ncbi:Pr6Pr family membrane protein [Williamsoniiplasma luminosum]|uniref:Uncharacterized protein n=1 Tax=Williamsoniiplasma luminosum TaxID=214888 RepID=A0A2S0NJH5_9MOLU|nr:Pr6Pr family membrane protein [Williamsoniiplasma luminosum]AVP49156.1 MAG: hypothetical protein C5T88_00975 [Williamsoniiplasma luminosum]
MKFNLKQEFKQQYLMDWKFWFKALAGSFLLCLIIAMYIKGLVEIGTLKNKLIENLKNMDGYKETEVIAYLNTLKGTELYDKMTWISLNMNFVNESGSLDKVLKGFMIGANFGDSTIQTFSYFTTLSNIAVGVWLLLAAFKPQNEGKKGFLSYGMTLVVTTYITITMLIYNGMLLPQMLASGRNLTPVGWLESVVEHMVMPLAFILYICFFFKSEVCYTKKQFMKKEWWKQLLVLAIYAIYIMVRGEMRYQGGKPKSTQYPYFFMDIHADNMMGMPGWAWLIIAMIFVIAICLGFSMIYHIILTKRNSKNINQVN